jgi:integrase
VRSVSLAQAREKAADCRRQVSSQIDPIAARESERARQVLEAAKSISFNDCAERYIAAHSAAWKNQKHCSQWRSTITTYCAPVFGSLPAQDIDTGLVMRALEPIWGRKAETASRVRGRVERILDWAKARGYRAGDNPARWRGHLEQLLPALRKKRRVKHHAALPFERISAFMAKLRAEEGLSARALEFAILTAARTGEVLGLRAAEVSMEAALWIVPADRMKAQREHRVPLSAQALRVLRSVGITSLASDEFVFAGRGARKPLSNMSMLMLLQRMEHQAITVHGFRSTFRDWAAECSDHPREVCELALAHSIQDQVEAAYRRGDLLEKRRSLMAEWANYCDSAASVEEVVSIYARVG